MTHEASETEMTEQVKADEAFKDAHDRALEVSQIKGALLANMRHELRTPLNHIIGYCEMLQEEAQDKGQQKFIFDLKKIHAAGRRLLTLVNDTFDTPLNIEANKIDLALEARTSLNAIIGYSEMLMEDAEDLGLDDFIPDLKKAHAAGLYLLTLVNNILDLSTIEAGKIDLGQGTVGTSYVSQDMVTPTCPSVVAEHGLLLVVDDNEINRDLLSRHLERGGYTVRVAQNGRQALEMIKAQGETLSSPFDLVLLDIIMPEMNGYQVLERLKTDSILRHLPVIVISASDEIGSVVKCIEMGAEDYLPLPFNSALLRARIGACLEKKRLRDQLEADNARKTKELETAHVIQQGFLPLSPPELPYLEIAAFQKPATEVGGDYYDFFLKPCEGSEPSQGFAERSKLIVAIGDATGHGLGSSLMVSATKTALLTINDPNLTKRICRINTVLEQINSYHRLNMGLTLVELKFDDHSSQVQVKAAGGGMPPIYILRSNGTVEEIVMEGLPLGAMKTAAYRTTKFRLERSDVLILMSDGLTERFNDTGEPFGYTQLVAEIQNAGKTERSPQSVLEALVQSGDAWSNHAPQNDDMTLVVLKVK
ncbi:SpoIIE family protein phosphatase [Candidatus Poribacteria bacterium]|nr:SpoIIE family protein phosphatase [Candidatus Poribacteria bacterium]